MSVQAQLTARASLPPRTERRAVLPAAASQLRWLFGGLVLAFAVPFVLADLAGMQRDLYYGVYVFAVVAFVSLWAWRTQQPIRALLTRGWRWALPLSALAGGVLVLIVLREPATARPGGWTFVGAVVWRGVVYGFADGLLLSVFPILAVFSLFALKPLRERSRKAVLGIGALALAVSVLFTAAYHVGYSDFRSGKVKSPMIGDVVWSAPTLLTLNPLGAPVVHVALHMTAVAHSYDTDLLIPPHR